MHEVAVRVVFFHFLETWQPLIARKKISKIRLQLICSLKRITRSNFLRLSMWVPQQEAVIWVITSCVK